MEDANEAFLRCRAGGDDALAASIQILGELYGSLSMHTSPEASAQLEAVYDACIRALGDACSGMHETLVPAMGVIRAIRASLAAERPTLRMAA